MRDNKCKCTFSQRAVGSGCDVCRSGISAEILPLRGKYYGTRILVKDGDSRGEINVWGAAKVYEPSVRELAEFGYTQEQWDNGEVDEGDIICDSHYEDRGDYELAQLIVDAINSNERR